MRNICVIAHGVIKELFRRKDFYFIFMLLLVVILYSSSISFGGERGFQRYFKEIGVTLTYIFSVIIAVSFAARQIPQEVETKTVYVLLAHPLSRFQFIVGKYFGVLVISAASFSLFYFSFIISLFLRGDRSTPLILLLEGYVLHVLLLGLISSVTIFLSLYLSTMANTWISLVLYFGTNWFGANIGGYIFLPHPELFDIKERIVHSHDIIPVWVISFLTVYAAVYSLIFLTSSYLVFRKRNL